MINKSGIISTALLTVGETTMYNDNTSDIYLIASKLLDDILLTVSADTVLLFNATEIKLTRATVGEHYWNIPGNFLSLIASKGDVSIIGEYFYSEDDEPVILYCRVTDPSNMPRYIENYLKALLTVELAMTNASYRSDLEMYKYNEEKERQKLMNTQAYGIKRWVGEE